ncbi:hypothetical protein CR969_00790 [Candidatus Saccharibacteria bacterium]|nr:MAG: hypothetical protein CR969_00790 [Candidatus Saccharibacteria bacterium]
MKKDVIYIDVEDDITTIIGKIKKSKEKIIALVPPKRIGVLQSVVNMRLLSKTAEAAKKRIVLITHDQALSGLAAAASIPIAKNLQSKPEIAEIPALKVDNDDDIIDGRELPVGELADNEENKPTKESKAVESVIAEEEADKKPEKKAKKVPSDKKVPNFNLFRKKFVLIGSGIVAFILFMVWAIWFAPHATVVITAKTTTVTVDNPVNLTLDGKTNAEAKVVKALKQEQSKELSVEFTATGEKNIGDKATGTVRFTKQSQYSSTVEAGTRLTSSSGLVFITNEDVTIPASITNTPGCFPIACPGSASVGVTAESGGANYNAAVGALSGANVDTAVFVGATGGGTDKMAKVVSKDDVEKAANKLAEKTDDSLKSKLVKSFGNSSKVIEESYREKRSKPTPSVAVGSEAEGPVKLKTTLKAIMFAIDQPEIDDYLNTSVQNQIKDKDSQKIYKNGAESVKFSQFTDSNNKFVIRLIANAEVGPEVNDNQVKEQSRGRSYGEIQSNLEAIDGIDGVDVKFSPFWVSSVPNDVNKITVEFKLENAS